MTAQVPRLSRRKMPPRPGIVHLGLGAFFRSFGAPMIEEAIAAQGGDWGIVGVSLRSPDIRDRLHPQDFIYTAVEKGPNSERPHVVEVLSDVIFAPDQTDNLLNQMADPMVRIVSMTVTEKGYCHVPSTGGLDINHPDIQHDIHHQAPRSAIGCIVRALQLRHRNGHRPFTVLSCDNLPNNGQVARNVVIALAKLIDKDLAQWIAQEARFPSTMVDRIVPATTDEDIARIASLTGSLDAAPVFHEPFRQWVIEDDFVDGQRPAFEHVNGVELVSDVAPFELMKIRMLNGTHSALAYLGYLSGYETISDTVGDPVFEAFVRKVWSQEIIPTLTPPQNTNLQHYANDLLGRYSNPAIRHRTWQIAMDGSQKLPQRILGTITDNQAAGRKCDGLLLAVAAWMRYVGGTDEKAQPIDVRDPIAERLRRLCEEAARPAEVVENLLAVKEVFGSSIKTDTELAITQAYEGLVGAGARASTEGYVAQ